MSTRRLLEVWEDRRSLEFRARLKDGQPVPEPESAVLIIRAYLGPQPMDWFLDGNAVEELHQFTYDLLAGPTRDPRLERIGIMCGEQVIRPNSGVIECGLHAGHSRVGNFDHVTADGILFDTPGF